jgi:hypothetical protein
MRTASEEVKFELWQVLKQNSFSGQKIIELLSQDETIKKLFQASAGVKEGYTIVEHTLKVFETFKEQLAPFQAKFKFPVIANVRLIETLQMMAALHDIGKPLAIAEGDKNRQHEFTMPLVQEQFEKFDFTNEETKLALAIVGHDYIGEMIKDRATPSKTLELLQQQAQSCRLSLQEFMPLQLFYYVIDAASYPMLRLRIFVLDKGLLTPDRQSFWELVKQAGLEAT